MKRRTLVLILSLSVAVLAAAATAVALIPTGRIADLAAARVQASLGREVRIGRARIDLLPTPGVALEDVSVAGAADDAPPLATVRRIVLRPKLLPLLARRVVVDAAVIERPRLLVSFDSAGVSNLPTPPRTAADEESRGGGGDIAFLIDRLEISDGRFAYLDARTNTAIRLDSVDQRLRLAGELRDGRLARIRLDGELDIGALGATLPDKLAVPIRDVSVHIAHDALLDRSADSLALDQLTVRVQELALEGQGAVRGVSKAGGREVSLRLATGSADVGELIRSLPRALVERMMPAGTDVPDVDGRASVRVAVDGPVGAGAVPRVDGMLDLEGFRLAWGGAGDLVTDLGGRIGFSLDSLTSDGLDGRLLGQPLHVAFRVRDPSAPTGDATLRTALDLDRATALGLVPDSLGARGSVGIDVALHGPLRELAAASVDGAVSLAGLTAAPPSLQVPVRVESGRLDFRGRRITSDSLRLRLGDSDLALGLTVDEWLPLALGDSSVVPTVQADARSRLFDADAVLGVRDSVKYGDLLFARLADREVDGRPAGEVAAEAGFGLPTLPPVSLEGRYRAAKLHKNGLDFEDVDIAFTGTGDRLELTDAEFQLMGGGVQVAGRLGLSAAGAAAEGGEGFPTVLSYQLRDVGAAAFFDRLTPFRNHLDGSLLLAGTARMVLDENLLPVRESVVAEGSIAVSDGRLANWPALHALGQKLGLARFDTLAVRDWAGQFRVTGPRVTLQESAFESDELTARAAGSFDFAGRLDLAATLLLSPELAGRVRGSLAPRLAAATADADGHIPVGVRITGPALGPEVNLDLSEAAGNAVAEARAAAEARARELAGQAAGNLIPGADSLAPPPDSARARLQSELKNRLKNLIKIKH